MATGSGSVPGSVIFFASNQLHGLRNVGTEPAMYHVVNFKTAATPAETPQIAELKQRL